MEMDCLHPLLGKPGNRGAQDRLRQVVLAVRKPLNLARSGLRLSREDSLEKGRENESAEVSERKEALDLFCGTKLVTRTLEKLGYAVTTLDVRPECKAHFTVDIRSWKY